MSILKAFGMNILFHNNNWALGNASMSWAFYICSPLAGCRLYCNIPLSAAKNNPLPLKLWEAASRGWNEMLCIQWNRDNSLSKGRSEAVGYYWNCVTSQHGACEETLKRKETWPSKTSKSRVGFIKAPRPGLRERNVCLKCEHAFRWYLVSMPFSIMFYFFFALGRHGGFPLNYLRRFSNLHNLHVNTQGWNSF